MKLSDSGSVILCGAHRTQIRLHPLLSGVPEPLFGPAATAFLLKLVLPTSLIIATANRIHWETNGPVILSCIGNWFENDSFGLLVDQIDNPVLLVR